MRFFVSTTVAPVPKTKDAAKMALLYAGILVVFALAQLFTFSGFLNLIGSMGLPGDQPAAHLIAALIVTAEIFAIPFLLRMRLSPLARVISMVLGWIVPFAWLLISLWLIFTINRITNSGFLGTVFTMIPGWWSVCISIALGIMAGWASWGLWPFVSVKKK